MSSTGASAQRNPIRATWMNTGPVDDGVYDRVGIGSISEMVLVPGAGENKKWRMWADHGVEFFLHPAIFSWLQRSGFRVFPAGSRGSAEALNSK